MSLYRRLVRWAFRRLYRELAWSYDLVAWVVSRGLWRRWVIAALPELRGRVLELGHGPGHLQLALAGRPGPPPIGLDPSPQMSARARRRLCAAGHPPLLLRGLAQSLPLPDASVDTVVATFPAEYILDPPTHREIARVLAPGGRLVVVDGAQFIQQATGAERARGRLAGLLEAAYERLIDLLYRLTLQGSVREPSTPDGPPSRLRMEGFALSARWVQVGPSRVALIIGERADTERKR